MFPAAGRDRPAPRIPVSCPGWARPRLSHLEQSFLPASQLEQSFPLHSHLEQSFPSCSHLEQSFPPRSHLEQSFPPHSHLDQSFHPHSHLDQSFPPRSHLDQSLPLLPTPGSAAPFSFPPGSEPPSSFPPGSEPPSSFPPGSEPPSSFPPGSEPPSPSHLDQNLPPHSHLDQNLLLHSHLDQNLPPPSHLDKTSHLPFPPGPRASSPSFLPGSRKSEVGTIGSPGIAGREAEEGAELLLLGKLETRSMMESRIKRLATTLMAATTDREPLVQEQISQALCVLGQAEPEELLHCCDEYLRQHDKLAYPHRVIILKAMETVVRNNIDLLDKSTAKVVIFLASNEMTKSKEVIWEWQQAASNVLVAVGRRFVNKVMEEVLSKFQPGILPHYFVLQTFANLAAANVFGMVPFLNSILGTMLPMLGMAKQDHMKSVFCYALQHFSESIQEYLANLDQAPDPTVRKDTFSNEIFCAYEVLFNGWLQHREAKLRLAVVEALGPMSYLMPSERLEEQLPKLIPGILGLYKKHSEAFSISKSLSQILEASVGIGSRSLDGQLDGLLGTLHPQLCSPADPSVPLSAKNHTEVLRCFTVLACSFPDRVLAFLLPKLESSNERTRVGTLLIMRQIINSAPSQMEIKKPFILSFMKLPLQDSNNKVRRALVQVISAMAHHGYLEQPGGEALLEFLVRQCALPAGGDSGPPKKASPDPEELTSDSVRSISVNTLFLLSTTVDRMSHVLWPFLLEFVTPTPFTNALTPLCKSLTFLALKRQEEGEDGALIRYDLNANLPSPHALTTRLLVVSSQPYVGDGRGAAALRLLHVLRCSVHPALEQLWNKGIPLLVEHLEENTEKSLAQQEWEEKLLQFLQDSLAAVPDNAWSCPLVTEMCRQLSCYNGSHLEKNFLYKCIGTTLGACASKELVQKQLQELLETARYQEEAEREGLASCFGICAMNHLEETLAKLEDFVRSDVFKKSVGLFSIFKDRSDTEVEKIKSTLILCYGHVAAAAPRELILPRVEADILRNIFQYFHTKVLGIKVETKDLTLKLCLIRSLAMLCQAVARGKGPPGFVLARKAELVAHMV
ncbi:maestro heat-like repeat-containing protein family member 1, partial [Manacus candei]|uniref:maestro heat-like repeat-containing protein family member 1 n=1 Tax=Manacus candei TaxID=415023 RepID=UPI00222797E3